MYKASKIICGDDLHIHMSGNDKRTLEIIEGTSIFIKISILGKVPPLKLFFEYQENKKN